MEHFKFTDAPSVTVTGVILCPAAQAAVDEARNLLDTAAEALAAGDRAKGMQAAQEALGQLILADSEERRGTRIQSQQSSATKTFVENMS